jgi:hypothetical protein
MLDRSNIQKNMQHCPGNKQAYLARFVGGSGIGIHPAPKAGVAGGFGIGYTPLYVPHPNAGASTRES